MAKTWTTTEIKLLKEHYPSGGYRACVKAGLQRSRYGTKCKCKKLGLSAPSHIRYPPDEFTDNQILAHYRAPPRRGNLSALAKRIDRPRKWIAWRARQLGVLTPRRVDKIWSDDEIELLEENAHCVPDVLYQIFKRAGYRRSATAIMVQRRKLRLRYADGCYSGESLAELLGVDGKTVTNWITRGWLKASKRGTRLARHDRDHWVITDDEVRRFVRNYTAHVDIRRVDKFWFVDLLTGDSRSKRAA